MVFVLMPRLVETSLRATAQWVPLSTTAQGAVSQAFSMVQLSAVVPLEHYL